MLHEVSGRMKWIMEDFVRECRRSGLIAADIRYESEAWNDEHDKLYGVMTYSDNFREIVTKEV